MRRCCSRAGASRLRQRLVSRVRGCLDAPLRVLEPRAQLCHGLAQAGLRGARVLLGARRRALEAADRVVVVLELRLLHLDGGSRLLRLGAGSGKGGSRSSKVRAGGPQLRLGRLGASPELGGLLVGCGPAGCRPRVGVGTRPVEFGGERCGA